ncbi:MAG: 23S rRNA (guanosine(2251)-2'-O)-methyltransferase RlmB [Bdellovibrionaceae bacterium]|nr:23S rRNA (guanosine(2251)-2'-O)-methyltransferase RlmB [Pseudobdellovibrionaceae bacterium]|tara:strand:+ start:785 stop:1504 length:720 start_codon:yes stop_codon:yes gene_type:complete
MSLKLTNPHSVLAAIESRSHDVERVEILEDYLKGPWLAVKNAAKSHSITVVEKKADKGKRKIDSGSFGRTASSSGTVREKKKVDLESLFASKEDGLWLALDCVQDPQNVGAIFRTAAFLGVKGVLMTNHRSAPLSSVVYDVSCGGVEVLPFAIETNLKNALGTAKDMGFWILGSSEHARDSYQTLSLDRKWLLVVGNEEKGMRPLTESFCDVVCTIPNKGKVTSLNVSVASAILMSHFC